MLDLASWNTYVHPNGTHVAVSAETIRKWLYRYLKNGLPVDICSLMYNPAKETVAASFILVGDETFEKKLQLQVMAPIRTRLTGIFELNTLNEAESIEFINFRLKNAQVDEDLFKEDAASIISSHCRGNRRQIMNMGTILMAEAFYRQEKTISSELIFNCDQIEISE